MPDRPPEKDAPSEPTPEFSLQLSRRHFLQTAGLAGAHLALASQALAREPVRHDGAEGAEPPPLGPAGSSFGIEFDEGAIVTLRRAKDAFDTDYIRPEGRLGDVILRYRRRASAWQTYETAADGGAARYACGPDGATHEAVYRLGGGSDPAVPALELKVSFVVEESALRWSIQVENLSDEAVEVGDLAVPLPMNTNFRQPGIASTEAVLKHGLVSGDNSFFFWLRNNSVGPYLTLTPDAGTRLEYWDRQEGYRVFVHSAAAGAEAKARGCNWRQSNTSLTLAPAGRSGHARSYGFNLHWADDYDHVRQILVDRGLVDVHVIPGMTVPSDLFARFALRTKERIDGVAAEFPGATEIRALGRSGEFDLYEVRFRRLGENRLTVRFGQGREMYLEFFATEPLEQLIRKRGRFIARRRHVDPEKWYSGLLAEWNMETHALLGPDNYDRIKGWRIYAVTCDDPGLSKPAFLAAKNAEYPVQAEVTALDDYIEGFVWGGLQRSTEETFPYGIYGIPDWKQNRESSDPGRNGRLHIWRIYDYPHIFLMYYAMYRVARDFPHVRTALAAKEYLRRAYGTAVAMFTIPYEVERWSAYRTGLYNELVITDILDALEAEGLEDHALHLRMHWERKVQFFINDNPDLFQSEYAFDSTGFESTHALAKYAVDHAERLSRERPRSDRFPPILPESTRRFMDSQMAANLFCRGWIETAYYYLGSDYRGSAGDAYTLSYMAQMGGWAVLDYAYHFADDFAPYLRLGYASFLSSWALMNTGMPESNYGYWYPGKENDGGAGGGFEPAPYGTTWLEQPHSRGSWYYSCEIDLGFCGALRGAATVLADDPIFGRFCYGGDWNPTRRGLEVVPRDGVRRRFHLFVDGSKIHLLLERDRFAAGRPIAVTSDLAGIDFHLESDSAAAHAAPLRVAGLAPGRYALRRENHVVTTVDVADGDDTVMELPVPAGTGPRTFSLAREVGGAGG